MDRHTLALALLVAAPFLLWGCSQKTDTLPSQQHKTSCTLKPVSQLPDYGCAYTRGSVTKIFDPDEFVLEDHTGKVEVFTNHTHLPLYAQETLMVKGQTHFSKWKKIIGFRKEIYATEVTLNNGQVIKIHQPKGQR